MSPPPRLVVRGIHKAFGPTVALGGVDLDVPAGEVHALVGENGAGKSTLMKVLSGAYRFDAGEIRLDGEPYAPRNPREARDRGIAMVYQDLSLAPHLTVEENVLLGIEPARFGVIRRPARRRRVLEVLAELEQTDIDPDARVLDLAPAARQLVEVARALAQPACRVLILDEPTSSLTAHEIDRLFRVIGRLRARGLAIVYISHFLEEIRRIADRFTVLRDGRSVGSGQTAGTSIFDIVRLMVGTDIEEFFPRSVHVPGEPLLEIGDLAGHRRPESASLTLRRGEVVGIAGPVGSGRTELLRAIFGLDSIRRGTIRVGLATGPSPPADRLAQGVGFVSEDRTGEGLAASLSIAENLTLSRLNGLGPGPIVWPRRQAQACDPHIQALGIRCLNADQPVAELSGGNQQKVAIARLLHHDVDVFLLDEPTRGVDVSAKIAIYRLIDQLACAGKAVLMVSSSLPELLGICDRVAVMFRGRLGPARPVRELSEHSLLLEATGAHVAAASA